MDPVKQIIKSCNQINDRMVGKDRTLRYYICPIHTRPCIKVIHDQKCNHLKENWKEINEKIRKTKKKT